MAGLLLVPTCAWLIFCVDCAGMNAIDLTLFASRIEAVCEEMGARLQGAAFSPNIKDRLDFSCAVFDVDGELCAQAAHIPVHLGSMAYAMRDIVSMVKWQAGDMVVLNDPYFGGTHLPDVTLIAPLFLDGNLVAFVANRAHHADIGAESPGSMPISRCLEEEGIIIPPTHLLRDFKVDEHIFASIIDNLQHGDQARGDFSAQISANQAGLDRLAELITPLGNTGFAEALVALNDYAARLASAALADIPDGDYAFSDVMDDDGLGNEDLVIKVNIKVHGSDIEIDFTGTAAQAEGNINCPLSVAAAGVYYVFRCLLPAHTPACAGSFRQLTLRAPKGCLLNAERPAAVAAGNVETSTRVVDVIMGALAQAIPDRIPAASHGSMNNIAMGSRGRSPWDYYETLGGGMGAGSQGGGQAAVQTHMTNTLNTPIEVLEMNYPLRISRYAIRRGSGGKGDRDGGDGLIREYEFLAPAQVTLLTERRRHQPWGLNGADNGQLGENRLNNKLLPGKISINVKTGDRLSIATPSGGAWSINSDD